MHWVTPGAAGLWGTQGLGPLGCPGGADPTDPPAHALRVLKPRVWVWSGVPWHPQSGGMEGSHGGRGMSPLSPKGPLPGGTTGWGRGFGGPVKVRGSSRRAGGYLGYGNTAGYGGPQGLCVCPVGSLVGVWESPLGTWGATGSESPEVSPWGPCGRAEGSMGSCCSVGRGLQGPIEPHRGFGWGSHRAGGVPMALESSCEGHSRSHRFRVGPLVSHGGGCG